MSRCPTCTTLLQRLNSNYVISLYFLDDGLKILVYKYCSLNFCYHEELTPFNLKLESLSLITDFIEFYCLL